MKNLDLNSIGVHEMSTLEMQETDGGIVWLLIVAGVILLGAASCNNYYPTIIVNPCCSQNVNSTFNADSTLINNNTINTDKK